jgi:hypothetical protein
MIGVSRTNVRAGIWIDRATQKDPYRLFVYERRFDVSMFIISYCALTSDFAPSAPLEPASC